MSDAPQYFDPMFEFDAPQGIDLAADHDDSQADKWFDDAPKSEEEQQTTEAADPLDQLFEEKYQEATQLLHEEPEPVTELPAVEEAPVEEAPVAEAPVEEAAVEEAPVEEAAVEEASVAEAVVEAHIPSPEADMSNPTELHFCTTSEWKHQKQPEAQPEAQPEEELSLEEQYKLEKNRILEAQRATMLESQEVAVAEPSSPILRKTIFEAQQEAPEPAVEQKSLPALNLTKSPEEHSPVQGFWKNECKKGSPKKRMSSAMSPRGVSRFLEPTASSASKKTPRSSASSAKRSRRSESITPMKLTVPCSPKFSGRKSAAVKEQQKSRDELEMEKAQTEVQRLKEERDKRRKNYQQSKAESRAGGKANARSTKPLTQPREFSFRTDSRPGASVKPESDQVSIAEACRKFQKDTPIRFRSVSKTAAARGPVSAKPEQMKLTQPDSPKFATSSRARHTAVKTTEELELEEMEKFQAHPFKANPVNKSIFQAYGTTGVKTMPKQALTVPEEPKFRVNERASLRPAAVPSDESPPKKQKTSEWAGPTVPHSPKLSTDARAACSASRSMPQVEESVPFKAQPMPEFSRVFVPRVAEHKLTEPTPFELPGDAFHAKAIKDLEAKKLQMEQDADEAANGFKAQPIREYHSVGTGQAPAHKLTVAAPFSLTTDVRHAEYERRMIADREHEEHEAVLARQFRASDVPEMSKSPFVPRKSAKPLTEIQNFELASDSRADKREAFDIQIQKKLEESLKAKKEQELRVLEEDKKAIAVLRKTQMSFKANPVMIGSQFTTKVSNKQLTNPESPALMTKSRSVMQK